MGKVSTKKESGNSADISAFILEKLSIEYLISMTIVFNKCATGGHFSDAGKI
jgi:hypothetical protein